MTIVSGQEITLEDVNFVSAMETPARDRHGALSGLPEADVVTAQSGVS
jgi:hypothetical protein